MFLSSQIVSSTLLAWAVNLQLQPSQTIFYIRISVRLLICFFVSGQYFVLLLEMKFLSFLDFLICSLRPIISKSELFFKVWYFSLVLLKTQPFSSYTFNSSLYIYSSYSVKIRLYVIILIFRLQLICIYIYILQYYFQTFDFFSKAVLTLASVTSLHLFLLVIFTL